MAFEPMHQEHENAAVRTRRVLTFVSGFVVFAAVLAGILGLFYRAEVQPGSLTVRFQPTPGPRLQPNPTQDYSDFHAAQQRELEGTRWVDRSANLIHVPIARAMAYVAAKGAFAYDPLEPASDQKLSTTPSDGAMRAKPSPTVAPHGAAPTTDSQFRETR